MARGVPWGLWGVWKKVASSGVSVTIRGMGSPALSSPQRAVLNTLLQAARSVGAGPKATKALVEAGLVESNLQNLNHGDRDSLGVLQQRPSQGWGSPGQVQDPAYAARKFLQAAVPIAGKYGTAGALAQAVQRSAFPGRYQASGGLADKLIGGGKAAAPGAAAHSASPGLSSLSNARQEAVAADPSALIAALAPGVLGDKQASTQLPALLAMLSAGRAGGAPAAAASATQPQAAAGQAAPTGGGYVNPFGKSLVAPGRIDEGVDPTIRGPIRAIGDAKVVALQHNFYKGQPYLVYQLTAGPHAGRYVYVSELITPHVQPGQTVRAGQVIATGNGAIETGWAGGAQGGYMPQANRAQGGDYTEGKVTGPGQSFALLLERLGAKAAR